MPRLEYRQEKIQKKRKQTPWRKFVKEICSWHPIVLTKVDGNISRYPSNERMGPLVEITHYQGMRDGLPRIDNPQEGTSFFDSFAELYTTVPRPYLIHDFENSNTSYADIVYGAKNVYLSIAVGLEAENIFYSYAINSVCTNVLNSVKVVQNCDNIFSSVFVTRSSNVFYSKNIQSSSDIRFSSNLVGCHDCILCDGLTNQSFCIENKPYPKEEYVEKKNDLLRNKGNFSIRYGSIADIQMSNISTTNCTGSGQFLCEGLTNGFISSHIRGGNNVALFDGTDHSEGIYDTLSGGINCSHWYGVTNAGYHMDHAYCCADVGTSSHIYYCMNFQGCSHCLGCIGLKNKSFCIFNKQYEKEEWFEKVDEIFSQMKKEGTLGEFFPGRMNPFYFNDTAAYLIDDSFTKEEVEAEGYLRRDEEIKVDIPEWMEVVKVSELDEYEGWMVDGKFRSMKNFRHSEGNEESRDKASVGDSSTSSEGRVILDVPQNATRHIDPSILKKVIQDEEGNVYRVIKMEYDFLVKHGLPLPRKHRLERLKGHFKIGARD